MTVPLRRPSSSRRSVWISGTATGGLGPDRPQRPEPDGEVADPRRVALEDVERAGAWPIAAEAVAADRRRQERAARDADLVGARATARRRRGRPARCPSVVPGAPRTMATSLTIDLAAAQERPEPVRPDGEDHDESGHRQPRPLATVEPAQDEVVDRPDEQDVGDQEERSGRRSAAAPAPAAARPALTSRLSSTDGQAAVRARRQEAAPQVACELSVLAIQSTRRVEAEERHRARAVRPFGGDDAVADRGERPARDELAGQGRERSSRSAAARRGVPVRLAGRDVGRDVRPVGQERRPGRPASAAGPVVPPAMTRRPPPATQPRSAASWPSVSRSASTSCQTIRSSEVHASTRSGRSSGVEAA